MFQFLSERLTTANDETRQPLQQEKEDILPVSKQEMIELVENSNGLHL